MTSADGGSDRGPYRAHGPERGRAGLDAKRLVRLAEASVTEMRIDLDGAVVVTEAATGAYAVTPIMAALAGARRVFAFTRPTRYGSVAEVVRQDH